MAAFFQHQGTIVTTFPSVVAEANKNNTILVEPNSLQDQERSGCKQFLKRELKVLGVVQIMLGIIQIVFGFVLLSNDSRAFGIPWWTGVWYIISGSLAVLMEKIPKKFLIIGNIVMNILSSIAAGLGIIFYMILLFNPSCFQNASASSCHVPFRILVGCLMVFTGLEFVISIVASRFACCELGCGEQGYKLKTIVIRSPDIQNSPTQPPDYENSHHYDNYETLIATDSSYETLKCN